MTTKQMHLNGVPLVAMKEKTAKVLLGKYLTSKPASPLKPKETEPTQRQTRASKSPLAETINSDSFVREGQVPHYAKPLRTKVKPLETPSFKQPTTAKQNLK